MNETDKSTEARELLAKEMAETERRRIRQLLAKPMNKRTHFLRKRLPNGGSCL